MVLGVAWGLYAKDWLVFPLVCHYIGLCYSKRSDRAGKGRRALEQKIHIYFYCLNVTHMIVGRASVNKMSKLGFTVFAFYVLPLIKFD